jgi:hypothetical protein
VQRLSVSCEAITMLEVMYVRRCMSWSTLSAAGALDANARSAHDGSVTGTHQKIHNVQLELAGS